MKPAIEVKGISKSYQISHQEKAGYDTIKDDFAKLIRKPFGGSRQSEQETFWALKDINFQVNPGETLGIIGKNGSGKSTLLKILSRIVDPTVGSIAINGKVASLLEVGTGFHPELTGRENIYFNGSMIGMSKQEITKKFDEIVAFSEVEKFLDTPVKFYSSGMFVRLAFSVAAHLDSEILILDEVLSVGDSGFQKKSMDKMLSVAKDGRTILFVSHSPAAVENICTRAILLRNGKIVKEGKPYEVIGTYTKQTRDFSRKQREANTDKTAKDKQRVKIKSADVTNLDGNPRIRVMDKLKIRVEFDRNFKKFKSCQILAGFYTTDSLPLFRYDSGSLKIDEFAGNWLEFETDALNLVPVTVDVNLALNIDGSQSDYIQSAITFKIEPKTTGAEVFNTDLATIVMPIKTHYKKSEAPVEQKA